MQTHWPHFSELELACRCGRTTCPVHGMSPAFMSRLERLRTQLKIVLPISSGYRCPEHNQAVSNTGMHGPHTQGRAVDIHIFGSNVVRVISLAIAFGFSGFGLHQRGPLRMRFVHLDDLRLPNYPRPRFWTY